MPATRSKPVAKSKPIYSVHPSVAYVASGIAKLKANTGRTFDEWMKFANRSGPKDEAARREWLKAQGLGTNQASWVAQRSLGKGDDDGDPTAYLRAAPKYVEAMYAGKKAHLKPIHDALIELGRSLGDDVKVCPCQTMVPLYRRHVFAQIKPTTLTRIDFGLYLKGAKGKLPKRLIDTGGLQKGDRITHRIEIASVEDIDAEVRKWLKTAYDLSA
jgi:hypothetical protein